jgi:phosphoribosyl-AMP cyclohydrolase
MDIDFEKADGLAPAIVQDAKTGKVLMLGYMNEEAYQKTLETGNVTFYSRSRNKLWIKGETSGHFLKLDGLYKDCDSDAILVKANPIGPGVCHEGYESCFYRLRKADGDWQIVEEKTYDKDQVYNK